MVRFIKNGKTADCNESHYELAHGDCCCNCGNLYHMMDDRLGYVGSICALDEYTTSGELFASNNRLHGLCELHYRVGKNPGEHVDIG